MDTTPAKKTTKKQGGHNGCQIQKVAEVAEEREQRGEGATGKRDWAEESGRSVKAVMCSSALGTWWLVHSAEEILNTHPRVP